MWEYCITMLECKWKRRWRYLYENLRTRAYNIFAPYFSVFQEQPWNINLKTNFDYSLWSLTIDAMTAMSIPLSMISKEFDIHFLSRFLFTHITKRTTHFSRVFYLFVMSFCPSNCHRCPAHWSQDNRYPAMKSGRGWFVGRLIPYRTRLVPSSDRTWS